MEKTKEVINSFNSFRCGILPDYEWIKCENCKKLYPRAIHKSNNGLPRIIRGINTINCSKKCSKKWLRKRGRK